MQEGGGGGGQAGEKNRETAKRGKRGRKVTGDGVWVGWEFRVSSTPGVAAFNPPGCIREERALQGLRLRIGATLADVFFSFFPR